VQGSRPSVVNIPEEVELELLKRLQEEDIGIPMSKNGNIVRNRIFSQL
jgi:hypothetical protein